MALSRAWPSISLVILEVFGGDILKQGRGFLRGQLIASLDRFGFLLRHNLLGYRLGDWANTAGVPLATIKEIVVPTFPPLVEAHCYAPFLCCGVALRVCWCFAGAGVDVWPSGSSESPSK